MPQWQRKNEVLTFCSALAFRVEHINRLFFFSRNHLFVDAQLKSHTKQFEKSSRHSAFYED